MSKSEVIQQAEDQLEQQSELTKTTSKETQLDSSNWLEDNLNFLGQALQVDFQGAPTGTCTKFLSDKKVWCGAKERFFQKLLHKSNNNTEIISDPKKYC